MSFLWDEIFLVYLWHKSISDYDELLSWIRVQRREASIMFLVYGARMILNYVY